MKILWIVWFCCITVASFAQEVIKGTLYDYKTGKPISLNLQNLSGTPEVFLDSSHLPMKSYNVKSDGSFSIPLSDINALGDSIRFSLSIFGDGAGYECADMDIINIPGNSFKQFITKVVVKRAWEMTSGGDDNFIVNNRKTFADSVFVADNGYLKYKVRRWPMKITQRTLGVKYVADLSKDIIK